MNRVAGFILALTIGLLPAAAQATTTVNLSCQIGPIEKTYGGTKWLVYECDDKESIVLVTAPGSPAAPFTFMFWKSGTSHQLHGEGTGEKTLTDAAYHDLSALTETDISALLAEIDSR